MPEQRRKFSPQFKAEAVQMVIETGKPVAEVARDLGIHDGTLGNWVDSPHQAGDYGAKWPKAVAKTTDDLDVLLAFYDYPLSTGCICAPPNPIDSTFATVRLRTVTKGPGSRAAGVAMAFKLIEPARAGGGRSTHRISSPSSGPARASRTASSSNDPTNRR